MSKLKRELVRIGRQVTAGLKRRQAQRPDISLPVTQTDALIDCALKVGREDGFEAALPLWLAIHAKRAAGTIPKATSIVVTNDSNDSPFEWGRPATGPSSCGAICIYTALFGNGDTLRPPMGSTGGIPLICFTDQDIDVPGWKIVRVESDGPPLVQAKRYKVFPHRYLPEFNASLYVDANRLLHGNVRDFIERWLAHERFVGWPHASRIDAYAEAEAVLVLDKHEPEPIVSQIARYQREGLPRDTGLIEANFLWRRHDIAEIRDLMEAWWSEMEATGSWRDQISFAYLTWKTSVRPKVLPPSAGTSRRSAVSSFKLHIPAGRGPYLRTARAKAVTFLYHPRNADSGSTVMRGCQLSEIARRYLGNRYEITYTSDAFAVRDSLIILNKSALARLSPAQIYRIRARNAALIGDFVDDPVSAEKAPLMDALICSSIDGLISAQAAFPNIATSYVPHHVDPRLPRGIAQQSEFSIGYFGEPTNAVRSRAVSRFVDFVHVDTARQNTDWMSRLANYSMHYVVRPYLKDGGFKPFLKGFTAAHCGAIVVAPRDEHDAIFYLGSDYPFLLESRRPAEIVRTIKFAHDSFDGREWRHACDVMAFIRDQTSDEKVATHLGHALDMVA